MPRRVLVTGVSGFVGPHLARALARAGAEVSGLGPETEMPRLEPSLAAWHVADLRDLDSMKQAVAEAKPDAVVHLAGQSSAARSFEAPQETFTINALGTWNLLDAVKLGAPRARVLVVGTSEVYGPQPEGSRVAEDAPFAPVSPYALSKAAADAFAEVFSKQSALDCLRTRSFGHTGPGQTDRFVVPAFAKQIAAIEAGRVEPVLRVGNLEVTRDLLDVRDVVSAYVALIERGTTGAAYNVCRGIGVKLTDVVRMLAERSRVPIRVEPDPSRMRPADVPYLVGDPTRIERDTGWRAEIPFERTLDDVLEEWRGRAVS
jgi:GDP-4-dehydro-6-deoxy-D-mannose reductase